MTEEMTRLFGKKRQTRAATWMEWPKRQPPEFGRLYQPFPRSHSNFHNRVSHNNLTAVRRHYARRELSTGILEVSDQLPKRGLRRSRRRAHTIGAQGQDNNDPVLMISNEGSIATCRICRRSLRAFYFRAFLMQHGEHSSRTAAPTKAFDLR